MNDYLNVYDLNRQKSAVLQNAFEIRETQELNKIYTLDFKIPADDVKVQFLQPFHYVRFGDTGQLYRIIKTELDDSDTPILSVSCEHVIATLCDDLMFGSHQFPPSDWNDEGKTRNAITWLLSKQKTPNWILDACDFSRRFEYLWEQENILNALYSIPKEFTKAYKWVFDTSVYPWRLSLKAIDATIHPEYYIRAKRNLLSSGSAQEFTDICTRIYPLGYGEGVNQLGIKDINNNLPYLQSPSAIVAQYGIKEKVLVDRRFENAESLKEYGQTMLDALQTPSMSRSFDVVDLYPLTSQDIDSAEVGKICKLTGDDTIAYVTKTVRVLDQAGNLTIDLSTKATDVASTIADLADRVRIESVYAQGATQLYQHSKDANATTTKGMIMSLYFPSEMRQINKVLMRLKLGAFRSYSQATENGGGTTATSSSGGGTTATSTSGGGTTATSTSGGGTTATSSSGGGTTATSTSGGGTSSTSSSGGGTSSTSSSGGGASSTSSSGGGGSSTSSSGGGTGSTSTSASSITLDVSTSTDPATGQYDPSTSTGTTSAMQGSGDEHYHNIPTLSITKAQLEHSHTISGTTGSHSHSFSVPDHSHSFSVPAHSHSFSVPAHTHTFSVPGHTHTFSVPDHTHKVTVPDHEHKVTIENHSHNVTIGNHSHTVTIPAHAHTITPGIFENGNATRFDIYVNNTKKATVNSKSYDGDITAWLLNVHNQIPRDSWIDVEIRPNDLAYVQCSVFIQGFVQSRGGGNY